MLSKEYIAGLFDGEGHVSITVTQRRGQTDPKLCVKLTNTHLPVMDMVKDQYGGVYYIPRKIKNHYLQVYQLSLNVTESKRFLTEMLPYLVIKKRQAELALEFSNTIYRRGKKPVTAEEKQLREELMIKMREEKSKEWIQQRQLIGK